MPGARRARSPACSVVSTRGSHHGHAGTPGIPRAMVLTVSFAFSPATNSSCHRQARCFPVESDSIPPARPWRQQRASGPRDFAVRIQHPRLRFFRAAHEHESVRPALPKVRADAERVHRIPPRQRAIEDVDLDGAARLIDVGLPGSRTNFAQLESSRCDQSDV
jgi:hypothetical protein